jgi:hypothetical protein
MASILYTVGEKPSKAAADGVEGSSTPRAGQERRRFFVGDDGGVGE